MAPLTTILTCCLLFLHYHETNAQVNLAELLKGTGATTRPAEPQAPVAQTAEEDPGDEELNRLIDSVFNQNNQETTSTSTSTPAVETHNSGGSLVSTTTCDGECVPYYLCKNNTIIQDGEGLLDIRMKAGPCESYFDVCCALPNKVKVPITTARPVTKVRQCGQRNPDGVGFRITGDKQNEAQFGEFPWMVAILREENINGDQKVNVYQCGGSLIHPKAVLTAAHCVIDPNKQKSLKIRAGEWDTQTKNELYPHQDRDVEEVVIHKDYNAGSLFNDVAILFLKSPVEYAENVDVVCIPQQPIIDRTRCFASGWGKDVFGQEGHYQVILKKIDLPIVPRENCLQALRNTRLGNYFILDPSFICAGGEAGKDTCKGDGGSPLVCPVPGNPKRFEQAGIVSWGIGCGEDQTPGVYGNVALFKHWIDEQMIYKNLGTSSYTV